MNLLDRAIGYVSPAAGLRRQQARQQLAGQKRFYDAARPSRGNAGWTRPFTSARSETYLGLPWLRASAHDLARNNPHVAKAIASLATNIVGTGITPKANTGNKRLNKKVDAVAAEFFAAMDADGITSNLAGFQLLMARAFLEGGEAVIRRYLRRSDSGLPLPVQFALFEGDFIDHRKNEAWVDGGRIVEGIEFSVERRRIAYWMFREHPGDTYMGSSAGSSEVAPVPAADIRLVYEPQRPGQQRGVPWITPILLRAKALDDYEDAERRRKSMESSMPVVVRNGDQAAEASDPGITTLFPTVTDANGNLVEIVTPASIMYARNATSVEFAKPADAMGFAPFKRAELQSIAAGARSTYELLSGDLSQTNFSSIQTGLLDFRGMVDMVRTAILYPHYDWLWRCMIDAAIVAGRLPAHTGYGVEWHPPPWLPVDPQKQAEADLADIRSGKKTLRQVVVASGRDFDEHLDDLAACNKGLDNRKIILDSDPRRTDKRGVEQAIAGTVKGNVPPPAEDNPDAA